MTDKLLLAAPDPVAFAKKFLTSHKFQSIKAKQYDEDTVALNFTGSMRLGIKFMTDFVKLLNKFHKVYDFELAPSKTFTSKPQFTLFIMTYGYVRDKKVNKVNKLAKKP